MWFFFLKGDGGESSAFFVACYQKYPQELMWEKGNSYDQLFILQPKWKEFLWSNGRHFPDPLQNCKGLLPAIRAWGLLQKVARIFYNRKCEATSREGTTPPVTTRVMIWRRMGTVGWWHLLNSKDKFCPCFTALHEHTFAETLPGESRAFPDHNYSGDNIFNFILFVIY